VGKHTRSGGVKYDAEAGRGSGFCTLGQRVIGDYLLHALMTPERPARVARGPVRLVVLGEAEVESAVAGIQPAGGDDFSAGIEVDAFAAVGVGVAEQ
jgi:hypothetical protein